MTISNATRKAGPFNCNGATTEFSFEFKCFDSGDVRVVLTDADELETDLTLTTDYTVALNADQNASPGGSITTVSTYASGNKITLVGNVDFLQGTDLTNGGAFSAETIENSFDKVTMQVQQLNEAVERSVKTSVSSTEDPDALVASLFAAELNAANSASSASASATSASGSATSASTSASTATTQAGIATTQAGNAAASAAAALVSENNAETAETNAAASAASIVGDVAAAAASAAAAETSETNAATSASNAATSATNASNSATAAQTAETNAETAETNAAASAADAAQSAADAAASAQGVPTGSMLEYGGSAAPTGFLLCDGANVDRTTYATLFTAIGTNFGVGDGSTTFGLPDFRRRVAVGSGGTGSGTLGNAVGNSGGAETHTLVSGEMPSHTHTQDSHNHTLSNGTLTLRSSATNAAYATGGSGTTSTLSNVAATATNQNTGGGGSHNNMQPSLVVTKIIKI